jgi:hypothetical protein
MLSHDLAKLFLSHPNVHVIVQAHDNANEWIDGKQTALRSIKEAVPKYGAVEICDNAISPYKKCGTALIMVHLEPL